MKSIKINKYLRSYIKEAIQKGPGNFSDLRLEADRKISEDDLRIAIGNSYHNKNDIPNLRGLTRLQLIKKLGLLIDTGKIRIEEEYPSASLGEADPSLLDKKGKEELPVSEISATVMMPAFGGELPVPPGILYKDSRKYTWAGIYMSAARKSAGWLQKELGEKLGITQREIFAFESGIRIPDITMANKLIGIFQKESPGFDSESFRRLCELSRADDAARGYQGGQWKQSRGYPDAGRN